MFNRLLAYWALGGDPLQERRDVRAGLTFAEAAEKYAEAKHHEFRNPKDRRR